MDQIRKVLHRFLNSKSDYGWLLRQTKGIKRYILGFFLINLAAMLFSLVRPYASKLIVDAVTGPNPALKPVYVILMMGTSLLSILLNSVSSVFSSYVNEKFAFSVRARMFDRVQRGRWLEVSKYHSGDLMARLNNDVGVIASNIIGILPSLLVAILQLSIILVIVLSVDPVLAVIGLVAGPLGVVISLVFRRPLMQYHAELQESESEYYTFFQETLSNLGVVKSFQMEDRNRDSFQAFRKRRLKTVIRSAKMGALMSASARLVYSGAYVIAFVWCARQLLRGVYSYGTMTMFLSLVSQIQGAVSNIGSVVPRLYSTVVSTTRVREITEQGEENLSGGRGDYPPAVGLSARNVSFTYDNVTVLKDISFEIPPMSHVGIVGSSGAGKTTLIRLLLALTEPDCGELEYVFPDGTRETASPATRRLLSYVPQGNTLMTGTVRENLLVGNPEADETAMWEALELADAADFLRKDPRGLDTAIKERSGGLSAGQAQRIGIARALMRQRPVLIFDEATSALDEKTEKRIFERLVASSNKTCFIITHRSSMLRYCDTVMDVQDDGHISIWKQTTNP